MTAPIISIDDWSSTCVCVRADIDECANVTCMNGGTCLELVNDYRCLCAAGYTGSNCDIGEERCKPTFQLRQINTSSFIYIPVDVLLYNLCIMDN